MILTAYVYVASQLVLPSRSRRFSTIRPARRACLRMATICRNIARGEKYALRHTIPAARDSVMRLRESFAVFAQVCCAPGHVGENAVRVV
jgi:hypothetical protein